MASRAIAPISSLRFEGRSFLSIVLRETGEWLIPSTLLEHQVLYSSALEVVDITPSTVSGFYRISARGSIAGTELLTANIRLDIRPKISVDALHTLLRWSTHALTSITSQELPVSAEPSKGIVETFADRLLDAVIDVQGNGWMPEIHRSAAVKDEICGDVDLVGSLELIHTRLRLEFVQAVDSFGFDSIPNRLLRTAIEFVAAAPVPISDDARERARLMLSEMPACGTFARAAEAEDVAQMVLNNHTLDGSRAYYYPALEAAVPILQMLSRYQGGSKEIRDVAMRIGLEDVFESAVRNVLLRSLSRTHSVRKESAGNLYAEAMPREFNPKLIPDVIIRPLGKPEVCDLIIDAKYKDYPSAQDHYQLASYLASGGCSLGAFITVGDPRKSSEPAAYGVTAQGGRVFEFRLSAADMRGSLSELAGWVTSLLS